MAVVYLDLDGFKEVNDTLGHDAGDSLLKMVGGRLVVAVREVDTVARPGWRRIRDSPVASQRRRRRSQGGVESDQTVSEHYDIGQRSVNITISAGVGIYPAHGQDAATLLKSADLALHDAKHSGKNMYRVFDGEPPACPAARSCSIPA
jgi:two-component system cell cycle response regulator